MILQLHRDTVSVSFRNFDTLLVTYTLFFLSKNYDEKSRERESKIKNTINIV
jgi:hypothetical protein